METTPPKRRPSLSRRVGFGSSRATFLGSPGTRILTSGSGFRRVRNRRLRRSVSGGREVGFQEVGRSGSRRSGSGSVWVRVQVGSGSRSGSGPGRVRVRSWAWLWAWAWPWPIPYAVSAWACTRARASLGQSRGTSSTYEAEQAHIGLWSGLGSDRGRFRARLRQGAKSGGRPFLGPVFDACPPPFPREEKRVQK